MVNLKKKFYCLYLILSFVLISGFLKAQANKSDSILVADYLNVDSLISFAKTQLGTNYCYATADPDKGFDCSGFVYFVFNHFNIKVPRSSKEFKNFGTKIPLDSAKKGDVIVFTGTNAKYRSPGHVGIIIENKEGVPTFIHSSSGKKKGVIISDFNESPYYKKRFIKVVRVLN